ncbi:hypothetical protein ASPSYDRAFT_88403 [Aspergillus sydowii CBS 593.65]|uniref:Uncharacterized protein n=1 Tax=Aspergillus sydowii CBS 593.65 TaxID=1036612 RepID=A0A1L9TJ72_9EURO|nr:uncharacterized protein ASPSYDRAFT_88403 [Aspergillus sydowii CBS 593.65]OJJ59484.1 hypothetical protein ASPSYDRAFT_88403 [Aspergillus sydowii CBS 593.65]
MLATQMPPPASHLPPSLTSNSPGAEAPASHSTMSPALPPPQHSTVSHSSMACGLTSNATSRTPTLSRPKLTLQTSSLPVTFGRSTTGLSLSLATGATASPTVHNTFKNAYDVAYPPSAPVSPSRSTSNRFSNPSSPYTSSNPYQLPLGVKSILRNSRLERRPSQAAPNGPNGCSSSRRVFFPTKKQVNYRYPLEEEIKTVKYTARHSDIVSDSEAESWETSSDDDSDYSSSSLVSSDATPSDDETNPSEPATDKKKKKRKYRSNERQVRAVALRDGLEDPYTSGNSTTPQTPLQGRLKRRREWRWTLGPLDEAGITPVSSQSSTSNIQLSTPSESEQDPEYHPAREPDTLSLNVATVRPTPQPSQLTTPISLAPSDASENNTALSPEAADPGPPH